MVVAKRSASVTPAGAGKNYGDPDPMLSGTLSNFVAADDVTASYSRTPGEAAGSYVISATLSPADVLGNYDITYNTANFTIGTVAGSIFVLNSSASGAFTLSGNASLTLLGSATLFVDSSSPSAISASGNARSRPVAACSWWVVSARAETRSSPRRALRGTTVDPSLVWLHLPPAAPVMSVNLSGNSTQTINPGTYSQIKVSGNAKLTLNPGIYIIAGGGSRSPATPDRHRQHRQP